MFGYFSPGKGLDQALLNCLSHWYTSGSSLSFFLHLFVIFVIMDIDFRSCVTTPVQTVTVDRNEKHFPIY